MPIISRFDGHCRVLRDLVLSGLVITIVISKYNSVRVFLNLSPKNIDVNESSRDIGVLLCGSVICSMLRHLIRSLRTSQCDSIKLLSNYHVVNMDIIGLHVITLFSVYSTLVTNIDYSISILGFRILVSHILDMLIAIPLMVNMALSILSNPSRASNMISWLLSVGSMIAVFKANTQSHSLGLIMNMILLPLCVIAVMINNPLWSMIHGKKEVHPEKIFLKDYQKVLLTSSKYRMVLLCSIIPISISPAIIEILTIYDILSYSQTFLMITVINTSIKILFCLTVMNMMEDFLFSMHNLQDAERKIIQSRRSFLRYILHELRVPLNAILLGVQFLSDSDRNIPKMDKEILATIVESSGFIAETLSDILVLQTLESGAMKLMNKVYSISELISTVVGNHNEYETIAVLRGIKIDVCIHETVPELVIGDKFRIAHVLSIILSNAIKFSHNNSEIRIIVSVRPNSNSKLSSMISSSAEEYMQSSPSTSPSSKNSDRQSPGGNDNNVDRLLVFTIIDRGVGISESALKTIFIPFLHTRAGDLKRGRGSGLSLAICKEIVDLHNGTIRCDSVLDNGSTFIVEVPLREHNPTVNDAGKSAFMYKSSSMDSLSSALHTSLDGIHDMIVLDPHPTALANVLRSKDFRVEKLDNVVIDNPRKRRAKHDSQQSSTTSSSFSSPSGRNMGYHLSAETSEAPSPRYDYTSTLRYNSSISSMMIPELSSYHESQVMNLSSLPSVIDPNTIASGTSPEKHVCPISDTCTSTGSNVHGLESSLTSRQASSVGASSPNKPLAITISTTQRDNDDDDDDDYVKIPMNTIFNMLSQRISCASSYDDVSELQRIIDCYETNQRYYPLLPTPESTLFADVLKSKISIEPSTSKSPSYYDCYMDMEVLSLYPGSSQDALKGDDVVDGTGSDGKQQLKILIVDDVTSNRKILAMMLHRQYGLLSDMAEDGLHAKDIITSVPIEESHDIIFLDNTMPRMTGVEFSKCIRAMNYHNIIIGVTGNSLDDELQEFLQSGADTVLSKPLRMDHIGSLLAFLKVHGYRSRIHLGYRLKFLSVSSQWAWVAC